jgi:NADH-quinone oxidoreductase subunit H
MAKTVLFMNLFFGGAGNWAVLILKVFLIYMTSVIVGVVFPRFRADHSIRWFYKYALPLGIIAIFVTSLLL